MNDESSFLVKQAQTLYKNLTSHLRELVHLGDEVNKRPVGVLWFALGATTFTILEVSIFGQNYSAYSFLFPAFGGLAAILLYRTAEDRFTRALALIQIRKQEIRQDIQKLLLKSSNSNPSKQQRLSSLYEQLNKLEIGENELILKRNESRWLG